MSVYNSMRLLKRILPGLSVRKSENGNRIFLVDEERGCCIAEAIQGKSVVEASKNPGAWAIAKLNRRLDAIAVETTKYRDRIADLDEEWRGLNRFLGKALLEAGKEK